MKLLAPHGDWLKNKILANQKEIAIIFMGYLAKEKAADFLSKLPFTLYLPFKTSPYAYIWPVQNCEVYIVDTHSSSSSFLNAFVMCLFMNGASLIHYISPKKSHLFRRS